MKKSFSKIFHLLLLAVSLLTLSNCNSQTNKNSNTEKTNNMKNSNTIIVDVRTIEEWNEDGHAECTVNYPMDSFESKIEELKKYDKVIIVCRSGNRAGIAKNKLSQAGYTKEIENLGSWQNVKCNEE